MDMYIYIVCMHYVVFEFLTQRPFWGLSFCGWKLSYGREMWKMKQYVRCHLDKIFFNACLGHRVFSENGSLGYMCAVGWIDSVHYRVYTEGTVFMKPAVEFAWKKEIFF